MSIELIAKIAPKNAAFQGLVDDSEVIVAAGGFAGILSAADTDLGLALGTIDSHDHDGDYAAADHNHDGTYEPANANIQSHISETSGNPHGTDASDVGLGSVANVAQLPLTAATDCHVPSGFLNKSTSSLSLTENVGAVNDTFRVTITGTNFPVYCNGVKFTKSTEYVEQIGATTKRYYIYYNASGTLTISDSPWSLEPGTFGGEAPVCMVYWDAVNHRGILEEERHHAWRDVHFHHWAHDSLGARYTSGYGLTKPAAAGEIADFSIAQGEIYDEDIPLASSGATTVCQLFYHSGSVMVFDRDSTVLYKAVAGVPQYDNGTGLAAKTQSNTEGYFISWVYATNKYDATKRIAVVVGQDTDGNMTLAQAQNAAYPSLPAGFVVEWKLLYKIIWRYGVSATTWISTTDYRQSSSLPSGLVPTANVTAGSVSFSPAGNVASVSVQAAIEELDTEKAAATHGHKDRLVAVFEGGGAQIIDGKKVYVYVPWDCTINDWTLLCDQSGTISIDVWRYAYSGYAPGTHPVNGDSITGGNNIAVSGAAKGQDVNVTNWGANPQTLSADDVLCFCAEGAATSVTWCAAILTVTRSA